MTRGLQVWYGVSGSATMEIDWFCSYIDPFSAGCVIAVNILVLILQIYRYGVCVYGSIVSGLIHIRAS